MISFIILYLIHSILFFFSKKKILYVLSLLICTALGSGYEFYFLFFWVDELFYSIACDCNWFLSKKKSIRSLSLDLHGSWFGVWIFFFFFWVDELFYSIACDCNWFLDYFVLYLHASISSFYTIDKTTIYWL